MVRYAVLLAGGSGTRFWPASRQARPKQLLSLAPGGRSLLRATFDRLHSLFPAERTLVVTAQHLVSGVLQELPEVPPENLLGEPVARNTAPAVGLAAAWILRNDTDGVLAVFPADHHVADEATFLEVAQRACDLAERGRMVCLGIEPTRPETGFGYLEVDPAKDGSLVVRRFVEKPDLERARAFLAARGRFLWNSGTFFFRASTILSAIERHLPELGAALRRFVAGEVSLEDLYARAPAISIDFGVMERERDLVGLPLAAGWSDVGSWEAIAELATPDARGNASGGEILVIDARDCLVHAPGKLVALLGVENLVVVDTPDAILVCGRERLQEVRAIVATLPSRGRADLV
jgi:mannose-1-phosphate guanylyltransferase